MQQSLPEPLRSSASCSTDYSQGDPRYVCLITKGAPLLAGITLDDSNKLVFIAEFQEPRAEAVVTQNCPSNLATGTSDAIACYRSASNSPAIQYYNRRTRVLLIAGVSSPWEAQTFVTAAGL